MYSVVKEIHFCYGHRLLHYKGKCRHLHGHNGRVRIELRMDELDERSMVFDFGDINQVIKKWIDETLDHTMILSEKDPFAKVLKKKKERLLTIKTNPTAEAIARMIFDYARSRGIPVHSVTLWETPSSFAVYRKRAQDD